jgi:hypothetical protein
MSQLVSSLVAEPECVAGVPVCLLRALHKQYIQWDAGESDVVKG